MRRIAVLTGTRSEYGYLKPLMEKIEKDNQLILIPIITGMHLLENFGNSYKIVKKDFPNAKKVKMLLNNDNLEDMAFYLASGIANLTKFFVKNRPDILVILGDRSESLSAVIVALYLNIPIAHINGGDVTGTTIDESIRHAITKFAHIHFVHTKSNGKRVKKMGENPNRIFVVGALTIDTIINSKLKSKNEVFKKYNLNPNKKMILAVQHPLTTLKDRGLSQFKVLFKVLDKLKIQTVLIYPNCDAGGRKMIELIENHKNRDYLRTFANLGHEDYLSLMKSCSIMIGNSSSGIIEAPSFKIPVINIGSRQQGRNRSNNIIDVQSKEKCIMDAIDTVFYSKEFSRKLKTTKNKFGDGFAAEKIVKVLKEISINEKTIQKQITY